MNAVLELIFISVLPWIELRGGIPVGISMGLDPLYVFAICTLTDIFLIPVILVFLRYAVPLVLRIERINQLYQWNVVRTLKRYEKYRKWEELGLALFVAIPLPFTGVYSGTLVSYALNLRKREAFLSISAGATLAGILVTVLSLGILG
ncbi:MAG: small multi-drug export protein [Theionarchaea archaeon]|nr:small multi-drug export protein [Theionarchaea archaeon]MBU7000376.1 small multi-drug export protein [Theionarchaea archaeon]MBU7021218.1 small multi-drug export protein [Theionarchaea archaeon]MBU7035715.1 small multi-drug export protein [Theionarchaea archaeon]MBU7039710.1 small multi-drug export protein [Theionarchaea archaeon]